MFWGCCAQGVAPNVRTYSVAISAYADMKAWRQALALLQVRNDDAMTFARFNARPESMGRDG